MISLVIVLFVLFGVSTYFATRLYSEKKDLERSFEKLQKTAEMTRKERKYEKKIDTIDDINDLISELRKTDTVRKRTVKKRTSTNTKANETGVGSKKNKRD